MFHFFIQTEKLEMIFLILNLLGAECVASLTYIQLSLPVCYFPPKILRFLHSDSTLTVHASISQVNIHFDLGIKCVRVCVIMSD